MESFMDKYNRAVLQAKALRKGDEVDDHIIDSVVRTDKRIESGEVVAIKDGYKTGKGFLILVKEDEIEVDNVFPIKQ